MKLASFASALTFAVSVSAETKGHIQLISAPEFVERPLIGFHHGSVSPLGVSETYNYCNMPRTNKYTYQNVSSDYELIYVELIHRHHKRTPYAANMLPGDIKDANTTYPQITNGGEIDSFNHGQDLWAVYHDLLGFLPDEYDPELVSYRVTNNNITTAVFNQLIKGMYPNDNVTAELRTLDNLEPNLPCQQATDLKTLIRSTPLWYEESNMTIYTDLAEQDGINSTTYSGFFGTIDHFFDNLSSKTCAGDATNVTTEQFNTVMKLGHWEYDYTFYSSPNATDYGKYKFGNFTVELAQRFEDVIDGTRTVKYQHNIAHDGSISGLVALLSDFIEFDLFQWPGMGAEMTFQIYQRVSDDDYYLRILYKGKEIKFVQLQDFFDYLNDLNVAEISSQCSAASS